jgi:integrase
VSHHGDPGPLHRGEMLGAAEDRVFRRLGLRVRIAFHGRRKALHTWNMQHNHLSPAAVKAGLGPIGWHTLRHTFRAWLGDNGEPLTVQKELMRHASTHSDRPEYVWRRNDGLNAGSAWAGGEAGDGALMDVSGRQPIT